LKRLQKLSDCGICATHKKGGFFSRETLGKRLPAKKRGTRLRMKMMLAACLLLGVWSTSADAIDLAELSPCKPAAARYCDHSGGMTWNNLMRCGATLAAQSWRIGSCCREVLRRYGQL
jgi:hypothetical protein